MFPEIALWAHYAWWLWAILGRIPQGKGIKACPRLGSSAWECTRKYTHARELSMLASGLKTFPICSFPHSGFGLEWTSHHLCSNKCLFPEDTILCGNCQAHRVCWREETRLRAWQPPVLMGTGVQSQLSPARPWHSSGWRGPALLFAARLWCWWCR